MRKFSLAALGTAALAIGSTSVALAADLPVRKAPPPYFAPPFSWTGFYFGGNVGAAWLDKSVTELGPGAITAQPGTNVSFTDAAFTGGVQFGYNWQATNWVLGFEADFNWTDIDHTLQGSDPSGFADNDIFRGKASWFGTLRARIGYAPTNWLLYVTGGAAVARLKNEYGRTLPDGSLELNDAVSITKTRWGWTVGGGLEYAFTPGWSAKVEYLYMDFGTSTARPLDGMGPGVAELDDRMHIVRVGLNYRFSGPLVARY